MGRQADGAKRREWVNRLARHEASGLTVAEFCEWESVLAAAFYNWQKNLHGESAESQSRRLSLGHSDQIGLQDVREIGRPT